MKTLKSLLIATVLLFGMSSTSSANTCGVFYPCKIADPVPTPTPTAIQPVITDASADTDTIQDNTLSDIIQNWLAELFG